MNGQNSLEADIQPGLIAKFVQFLFLGLVARVSLHCFESGRRADLIWCCRVMAEVVLLGMFNGRRM